MAAASGASILAGLILFWLDARAGSAWLRSDFATGLSIGAGFALVGFVFGILIGRTSKAMAQLGAQIQGKPSSEQLTQMQAIQKRMATYSNLSSVMLILAVIFMAIARYM
jgi:Na+/glutamate symporter